MSALDFRAVIMCDDVRKEVSNKEILIGVYSGDIILPALPAWMPLAIWIELEPRELGKHQLEFRLSLTNKPPVTFKVGMDVHQLSTTSITIPGLQVFAESEGDLKFEFKENN